MPVWGVCARSWANGPAGSCTRFPGEGKGSGRHLRTGGRPAGNELGLRCLLGARILSQAQPPSSRCCVTAPPTAPGRKTAGCKRPPPRCGPDHGGPDCSGQPARVWTVGRNLPRFPSMSTPRNVTKQAPSGQVTGHPAEGPRGAIEDFPAQICSRTVIRLEPGLIRRNFPDDTRRHEARQVARAAGAATLAALPDSKLSWLMLVSRKVLY